MKARYRALITLKSQQFLSDKTLYWGNTPGKDFATEEEAIKNIVWEEIAILDIYIEKIYICKAKKIKGVK